MLRRMLAERAALQAGQGGEGRSTSTGRRATARGHLRGGPTASARRNRQGCARPRRPERRAGASHSRASGQWGHTRAGATRG
eukprot:2249354-Pleurochrysis_carterae.AAC.1